MSTRSLIGLLNPEDGSVKSIYCHSDGYTTCTGAILQEEYDTKEKVECLFNFGSLSTLPNYSDLKDTSINDDSISHYNSVKDFARENLLSDCEYFYLFDPRDNQWFVNTVHHPFLQNKEGKSLRELSDKFWDLFHIRDLNYLMYDLATYKTSEYGKVRSEFIPLRKYLAYELKSEMDYSQEQMNKALKEGDRNSYGYDSWKCSYENKKEIFSDLVSKNLIDLASFSKGSNFFKSEQNRSAQYYRDSEIYNKLVLEYNKLYDYKHSHTISVKDPFDFVSENLNGVLKDFFNVHLDQDNKDFTLTSKKAFPYNIVQEELYKRLKLFYNHNQNCIKRILFNQFDENSDICLYPCDEIFRHLSEKNTMVAYPFLDDKFVRGFCLLDKDINNNYNQYSNVYSVLSSHNYESTLNPCTDYLILGAKVIDSSDTRENVFNFQDKELLFSILVVNHKENLMGYIESTLRDLDIHRQDLSCTDKCNANEQNYLYNYFLKNNIDLNGYKCLDKDSESLKESILADLKTRNNLNEITLEESNTLKL